MTANEVKLFCLICNSEGLPSPVLEYMFGKEVFGRAWRSDFFFAHNGIKLSVEVEGIFYNKSQGTSRHQTGKGYEADMLKYNACTLLDIRLLRFTSAQAVKKPVMCCNLIKIALGITNIEKQLIGCFALPTKKKSLPKKNKSEK